MGVITLVLLVLLTESIIYHTCKILQSTKSIASRIVLVVIQIISFINRYGSVSSTGRDFGIKHFQFITFTVTFAGAVK